MRAWYSHAPREHGPNREVRSLRTHQDRVHTGQSALLNCSARAALPVRGERVLGIGLPGSLYPS